MQLRFLLMKLLQIFSFLTADPVERFGHVFRFKKDAPAAVISEIQISAPADCTCLLLKYLPHTFFFFFSTTVRQGDGALAMSIAKLSSSGSSEASPKRAMQRGLLKSSFSA